MFLGTASVAGKSEDASKQVRCKLITLTQPNRSSEEGTPGSIPMPDRIWFLFSSGPHKGGTVCRTSAGTRRQGPLKPLTGSTIRWPSAQMCVGSVRMRVCPVVHATEHNQEIKNRSFSVLAFFFFCEKTRSQNPLSGFGSMRGPARGGDVHSFAREHLRGRWSGVERERKIAIRAFERKQHEWQRRIASPLSTTHFPLKKHGN